MKEGTLERNAFMLEGPLRNKGYDWWWHSFTGYKRTTGEAKSFFIEYFVCNPGLGGDEPILGQQRQNKETGKRPSYAMIKCGTWGPNAKQIHNFYGISDFSYQRKELDIKIGECTLTERHMKGFCTMTQQDANNHPEYMSDAGEMQWDLSINKKISYSVGYGASAIFRKLNAFEMFWHAQGIKTEFSGTVRMDGELYDILPEKSFGYADKNWGADFTSPWLWISSCNIKSLLTGSRLLNSAFDFGGGRPKVFGFSVDRKLLGCFVYEGKTYEYNFSKIWTGAKVDFDFKEEKDQNHWSLRAKNRHSLLELEMICLVGDMLFVNYESPDGQKRHNRLWNGGTGVGRLKLYEMKLGKKTLIDDMEFTNAGCEYGEYDK